jgi:hypothetical protein
MGLSPSRELDWGEGRIERKKEYKERKRTGSRIEGERSERKGKERLERRVRVSNKRAELVPSTGKKPPWSQKGQW